MESVFSHPFPLIRAGGAFLMCAGLVFVIAWLRPKAFTVVMIIAFALAGTMAWLAPQLWGPNLGPPPELHVKVLIAAIVAEMLAIPIAYRLIKDERRADAWMLGIVGAHFLPMAVLLGPLALGLGLACIINAAFALSMRTTPIWPFGIIDSVLKVGFGGAMFFLFPSAMAWLSLS